MQPLDVPPTLTLPEGCQREITQIARRLDGAYPNHALFDPGEQQRCLAEARRASSSLDQLFTEVGVAIARDGIAVVKDYPVASDALMTAICNLVGTVGASYGDLIDEVELAPLDLQADVPAGYRHSTLWPHTDQSAKDRPPTHVGLGCVRDVPDSGDSILVDVPAVVERLRDEDGEVVLSLLKEPRYPSVNVPREAHLPAVVGPVLRDCPDGFVRARYRDEGFAAGCRALQGEVTGPSKAHIGALDRFLRLVNDEKLWTVFHLDAGSMMIFDNGRKMHGRLPVRTDSVRQARRISIWDT